MYAASARRGAAALPGFMRTRVPVFFLLFAWFAATAWMRPLAVPDEGRYVSVAWEMLAARDWVVPTLDGMPFFHKPPLFYWLADAGMALFGATAFAARLSSLLAATVLAWLMYLFTRRHANEGQARTTALVLATMPYFYFGAQYANMDMLVASCIGCCVLLSGDAAIRIAQGRDARFVLWAAYAAAGLGVLAKGLIGCVLPAGILLAWLAATGQLKLLRRLVSIGGLAIFAVIVLPWILAVQARDPGFFRFFFIEQQFERFAGSGFNNPQPVWFYLPLLAALTLPWSAWVVRAGQRWREARGERGPQVRMLMACWLGVVFVFFSIPQSKLVGYMLPAVAPLAWLLGDAIATARPGSFARRNLRAIAGAAATVMVVTVVSFAIRAPNSARPLAQALVAHRAAGEPVIFVDTYPYDFVFYARLRPPVPIVKDWSDPRLAQTDAWPREFLDGARFAGAAAGRSLVARVPGDWAAGGAARAWFVTGVGATPPAATAQQVASTSQLVLWRVNR